MRRVPHVLTAVVLVMVAARAMPVAAQDKPAAVVHMTMAKKFVPDKVTIKAGETVEWVADDPFHEHSLTTDPAKVEDRALVQTPKGARTFDSGSLQQGRTFRYKFTVAGTYRYVCPPHEQNKMVGEVVVTPQ